MQYKKGNFLTLSFHPKLTELKILECLIKIQHLLSLSYSLHANLEVKVGG